MREVAERLYDTMMAVATSHHLEPAQRTREMPEFRVEKTEEDREASVRHIPSGTTIALNSWRSRKTGIASLRYWLNSLPAASGVVRNRTGWTPQSSQAIP